MAVAGAERAVVQLAHGLCERGDEVAVAAAEGPLDAELAALGIRRFVVPYVGRTRGVPGAVAHTAKAVRRFRPDVVHAHNVRAAAVAAISARLARPGSRPPVLATFQGVAASDSGLASRLLRFADGVACVSDDLRRALISGGLDSARIDIVHNGISTQGPGSPQSRAALDLDLGLDDAPVIAIVGRLVPQKAHRRFFDALVLLADLRPGTQALVVGSGPLRDELERLAAELAVEGVTFTGLRRDAREIIARADLVVFSSDFEGMSLAALEALAAGTPVVATDVAGMRELLGSGAGRVVARDPLALAEAIAELLADDEERARMGAEGRRLIAERFSVEAMVDGYAALYEALLAGRPPQPA